MAHELTHRGSFGSAAAQGEFLHHVAFAEHARHHALIVDYGDSAGTVLDHGSDRIGNRGLEGHEGRRRIAEFQ